MGLSADPRTRLAREGLADARLEGLVLADRFVAVRPSQAAAPVVSLRAGADPGAEQVSQLLFGEAFDRLDDHAGFTFGQARRDGYVGWAAAEALREGQSASTHWVSALRAFAFEEPSITAAARGPLSLNALVRVVEETETLALAEGMGWIAKRHLSPIGVTAEDPAAVALAHLGAPYLWGGRDSSGLDCSGLVQQALMACGLACPRDADQQQALGAPAPVDGLMRGDLVFWSDHVGMMADARRLVHANAHHMAVAVESLAKVVARVSANGGGNPIAYRRLSGRRSRSPRRKP